MINTGCAAAIYCMYSHLCTVCKVCKVYSDVLVVVRTYVEFLGVTCAFCDLDDILKLCSWVGAEDSSRRIGTLNILLKIKNKYLLVNQNPILLFLYTVRLALQLSSLLAIL